MKSLLLYLLGGLIGVGNKVMQDPVELDDIKTAFKRSILEKVADQMFVWLVLQTCLYRCIPCQMRWFAAHPVGELFLACHFPQSQKIEVARITPLFLVIMSLKMRKYRNSGAYVFISA